MIPRLHVIVGPTPEDPALDLVDAVLEAGAPSGDLAVQIRVKGVGDRDAIELIGPVVDRIRSTGATAIVNDRVDLAVVCGAHGSHGGADDLPVTARARIGGPDLIVGATAREPLLAHVHDVEGAHYLGVGPFSTTTSKAGLPGPIGLDGVTAVARAVEIPVIAIGGVTVDDVGPLRAVGAHGVAVISAVVDAPDPGRATAAFLVALEAS